MSAQRTLDGLDVTARDHRRESAHEHYPTPRGLVRAVLERLVRADRPSEPLCRCGHAWRSRPAGCDCIVPAGPSLRVAGCLDRSLPTVVRIVDVGCGSGVWASEARRLFALAGIPVVITGIDNRAEVEPLARRWCDEVIIGDLRDVLGGVAVDGAVDGAPVSRRWDLLVSNPPFSALLDLIPLALECATASIILHTEQSLTRTYAMAALVERTPPRHELRIAQGVSFSGRGPDRIRKADGSDASGSDSRGYSVTTWERGTSPGQSWTSSVLRLPAAARGWTVRPGEEPASADLPEAPGCHETCVTSHASHES